ncbi:lysosomal cobalamin transporter ABCD4-like [Gigantopelta aegis]|uniref:lysosomal cobalamin transporter ABCD4-like n=1 Tax=Gigantopelta aegis TaxID=1735272 RepID=UPI001B889F17|nr:lysosomal cobalamin transporter ABCD4-like [Gigantopelta aegis]
MAAYAQPNFEVPATNNDEFTFDIHCLKRFLKLFWLMFPGCKSIASLLCWFLLCLSVLEQYIIYNIGQIPSKFYLVLGNKDEPGFKEEIIEAVVLILAEGFIASTILYVSSVLYLTWRENICTVLHCEYFKGIRYYTINIINKTVDNPDQRVTQDVDKLCLSFSYVFAPVIISPFTIAYYLYKAAISTGYIGPVSVVVFFIVVTIINKFLMSPVVKLVYKQELQEGEFRYKHMQMRVNAESAAFYRSGRMEKVKTNVKLKTLITIQHKLIRQQYALNCSIKSADYLGSILSYIALAVPIFLGLYNSLTAVELSALISKNAFVTIYLISSFTKLIDLSAKVTDMAGNAHRVGQLLEILSSLQDESGEDHKDSSRTITSELTSVSSEQEEADDDMYEMMQTALTVNNITYGPPNSSEILCRNLSFQLQSGVNILITGPSGCGKSSLLRVINGLWKVTSGSINSNLLHSNKYLFFLPQKVYFTNGSLKEQIIFPSQLHEVDIDEEKLHALIDYVGLQVILERTGGLDGGFHWNWYDELSPGEMQRLSFVRLFFHQPRFAVLDESTSQISMDVEEKMYRKCQELQITLMSVGHRDSVRQYHDMELHLDGHGGWTFSSIRDLSTFL